MTQPASDAIYEFGTAELVDGGLSTPDGPCNTNRWVLEITAEAEVVKANPPDPGESP